MPSHPHFHMRLIFNFSDIKCISRVQQTRCEVSQFIYLRRSTCFRRVFRPSSWAENCTYSVRYLSDKYLTLYVQFWAPDVGRKTRPKHVERLTEINKLRNVASCWLCSANILVMHGLMNVKLTLSDFMCFKFKPYYQTCMWLKKFRAALELCVCDFKQRSYNGWLIIACSQPASLVKSHSSCAEERIAVDWNPWRWHQ